MSSIVLDPAVKEMLLADCRDFLRSEDWCVYLPWSLYRNARCSHVALYRYAERGEFILKECAHVNNGAVFEKGYRSGVGICCMACQEGGNISRNGISCADVINKRQDLAHSLTRWRAGPGHLCR